MKTWAIVLFALFATWTLPAVPAAHARGADDDIIMEEDDTSKPAEEKPADGDLPADTDPAATDPAATDPAATDPAATDAAAAVAGDDKDNKTKGDDEDARSYWSDIKVVPRKLILKQNRIELIPYMGVTLNDNLIRHIALGGEFGYYMSDAMSIGVGGHMYMKQQTDRAYLTGLQQRVLPTLNQYLYTATLNVNYEAAYGKFAFHNKKILQWGIFLSGGLGVTGTEVIPRNAAHEPWTNMNITIQVGAGFRVFINQWLTLWGGVRNYMMQDKFENSNRTQPDAEAGEKNAAARFINNIVFQIGVSVFFPTSFEYTTFK
ncbi:outer membrane beta-barrel domain-containing protein [Myxococcota bacterium]|nr:outer membrane beta-barrel domain-containing protein [Myxococcota bacterium]MBU1410057.1 outer membrane beta-barrel domain-containing protein [Myxococcota bacterium]MBU1510019.1 outer membrane beta-barrel domain-containing protein [Myxococcota bacterium]